MTKPAGAVPGPAIGVGHDVEDDVVGACDITGHSANTRQVVEPQIIADPPGNVVVGTRCVSAHPDATNDLFAGCIETKASPENVNPGDLASDHRVLRGSVQRRWPVIRHIVIYGIAELQSE